MGHSPNQQTQNVTCAPTAGIGGVALFTVAAGHTFFRNQPVVLGGSVAPTGFTLGVTYYVANDQNFSDLTFALSATPSGPPIVGSSAGTSVTVLMPTGTFRVLRIEKTITEQWLTGQANATAAKAFAKNPNQGNQQALWKRRAVYQYVGTPNEDVFEYVVSAIDDGT